MAAVVNEANSIQWDWEIVGRINGYLMQCLMAMSSWRHMSRIRIASTFTRCASSNRLFIWCYLFQIHCILFVPRTSYSALKNHLFLHTMASGKHHTRRSRSRNSQSHPHRRHHKSSSDSKEGVASRFLFLHQEDNSTSIKWNSSLSPRLQRRHTTVKAFSISVLLAHVYQGTRLPEHPGFLAHGYQDTWLLDNKAHGGQSTRLPEHTAARALKISSSRLPRHAATSTRHF